MTPPMLETNASDGAPARPARLAWPELAVGLGLLLFAGLALAQIRAIPVSPLYSKIGPTVFPYLMASGLLVLAALLIGAAWRGGWQTEDEKSIAPDWRSFACVAAGLLANVLLIRPLGFTAASTLLFVLVARGFGSRRPARDAAVGFALALAAYFGFARALGVNIGAGVVENLLGG